MMDTWVLRRLSPPMIPHSFSSAEEGTKFTHPSTSSAEVGSHQYVARHHQQPKATTCKHGNQQVCNDFQMQHVCLSSQCQFSGYGCCCRSHTVEQGRLARPAIPQQQTHTLTKERHSIFYCPILPRFVASSTTLSTWRMTPINAFPSDSLLAECVGESSLWHYHGHYAIEHPVGLCRECLGKCYCMAD